MISLDKILVIFTVIAIAISEEENWTGKWFPVNPNEVTTTTTTTTTPSNNKQWSGKWFPNDLSETKNNQLSDNSYEYDRIMGIPNKDCDDGETNLKTDFDPTNPDHALIYTCHEDDYKPDYSLDALQTIYDVPYMYVPSHKCMNEVITYDRKIPTLGYHRPLWPVYGEYVYVPPQRWLHSLEHGAIVALYHPCADKNEIEKLKSAVKKCLYRHIITPYKQLSKERPLALVAWGNSIEMPFFDKTSAVEFIQKFAKTGPEKNSKQGQYNKMLKDKAAIVSDIEDSQICQKNVAEM